MSRGAAPAADPAAPRAPAERVLALDAFRGLVVAGMLLVNDPGHPERAPAQLRHAAWGQGITFADLVMPWFLLAIGVSIPFAVRAWFAQPRATTPLRASRGGRRLTA